MKTQLQIYRKIFHLTRLTVLVLTLAIILGQLNRPVFAQPPPETTRVEAVLATEPTARVVVALRSAETTTQVDLSAQQIGQVQSDVLSTVATEDFRLIHQYETLPGLVGEVTEAGLTTLRQQPGVEAVALDLPVEAMLTESAALIKADTVWRDFGLTGAGVKVAVLDSGIDPTHPDLSSRIVAQHCFNRNGDCPPDHTDESDSAQDEFGHGTQVAGIIAGGGETSPQGIAAQASLVAVRVLGSSGSGFTSDVLAGIDWVVANQTNLNVKVMNLSFGGGSYDGLCDQADANTKLYAAAAETARQAGITLFAASGNGGQVEAMMAPACVSGIVSVGNVYDTAISRLSWPTCIDENIAVDQVACSSNSSAALDLLAPGVLITSTKLGGGHSSRSGTSMSTAHATAVAALMLQANPDLNPSEIEIILKEAGVPVTDSRNGRVTSRLDALAAVTRVTGAEVTTIRGTVLLQGRVDHSGTQIFLSEESCSTTISGDSAAATTTEANGSFEILLPVDHRYQCLQAVQPGYLVGQKSSPAGDLGVITLPGGDATGDGLVNIFDLALIASRYATNDPTADLNANGMVDIFDLVLVASNYKQRGPVMNWQLPS